MARALHITFAARAVVARGYAFVVHPETYADADVALDELFNLPTPPEPLVLRVTATGGDAAERARVEGDWLCDAARGEPRRIPGPVWLHSPQATAWAKTRPWLEAWETCPDARWMLAAAASVGVDRRFVVRAACACARTVLDRIPAGEERPRRAIETAEAWTRGEATLDEVRQAANAAYIASDNAAFAAATNVAYVSSSSYAAVADAYNAAEFAASYADAPASAHDSSAHAATYASRAAYYASASDSGVVTDTRALTLARLAELVRGEIATWVVLRAATGRAR